ncbi:hypothetical protein [Streptomyces hirsutus]|uniref:hypothetical protein n=1 Tax=Streptomyces hirsutus TaxID=35620 RepID=UPI003651AF49
MNTDSPAVAHGYTIHDLDRIARTACAADRTLASDMHGRYDTAWSAIAEALCTADEPPHRETLVRVGLRAIYEEIRLCRRMYGVDTTPRSGAVASAPRFRAYWTSRPDTIADHIIERLAIHQVVAALTPARQQAVIALAVHDDYQAAADVLEVSYGTLTRRVKDGRDQARRLWYAPETAPATRGRDRRVGSRSAPDRCPQGHLYTAENTARSRKQRERRCRTCHRAGEAARYSETRAAA